ncbi:Transcription elongation factor [Galbibacter orientalis DSM 19592]|uniref:Transcription elongation factor n=2 Tax=Galbibacter TaxID=379068 RepID=I3C3G9_9FLAO|nr:Transcription elongation factor [Galbibacter orientalis DSM 19592]
MMKTTKELLISKCQELLNQRLYQVQKAIATIEESFASETKSSAGDKHETGRAMLQLEREKAGNRLREIENMLHAFSRINYDKSSEEKNQKVKVGSLIKTNLASYFIAVSLGQLTVQNEDIYCISAQSPIGQLLLGKTINDDVSFQSSKIKILEIH